MMIVAGDYIPWIVKVHVSIDNGSYQQDQISNLHVSPCSIFTGLNNYTKRYQ